MLIGNFKCSSCENADLDPATACMCLRYCAVTRTCVAAALNVLISVSSASVSQSALCILPLPEI